MTPPCKGCICLPVCLGKEQYDVVMQCDILCDHLVEKYKAALAHFGRCCITVTPLNKKFEIKYSHGKRGIVMGAPSNDNGFYTPGMKLVVNPDFTEDKRTMLTIGKVKRS